MPQPSDNRRQLSLLALKILLVVTLGGLVTLWAGGFVRQQLATEQQLQLDRVALQMVSALKQQMAINLESLWGIRGLYLASDQVTEEEFSRYFVQADLGRRVVGVQAAVLYELRTGSLYPVQRFSYNPGLTAVPFRPNEKGLKTDLF